MKKFAEIAAITIVVFLLVGGAIAIGAGIFMLLWNFVVPEVFNGPHLGFWHAVAVMLLLGFVGGFIKNNRSK